jgi:hypothetical protein
MPETDDLCLITLKGHLLVEEMLTELVGLALPNAQYLSEAHLTFYQLACVARSAVPLRAEDTCWEVIFSLNRLRNDLSHCLEPPRLIACLEGLWRADENAQPFEEMYVDKSMDADLGHAERLRLAIVECMKFLGVMIGHYEGQAREGQSA